MNLNIGNELIMKTYLFAQIISNCLWNQHFLTMHFIHDKFTDSSIDKNLGLLILLVIKLRESPHQTSVIYQHIWTKLWRRC